MFTKDTRTETFLTQMGVDFRYANRIAFNELHRKWRETNLSRPVPVREEAVLEYASLMSGGSPAPAPILHKTSEGYMILDGIQRTAAAELATETGIAAYVVTCDSMDILLSINLLANARLQGRAEPAEWTRRRAVEVLVVGRGMSVEEVARMGGWKKTDIQTLANMLGWAATVKAINGPEVPDTILSVLAENVSQDELLASGEPAAKFLETLKAARFSADDAAPYIRDFFQPSPKGDKRFQVLSSRLETFKSDPEVQIRILGRKSTGLPHDVNLRRAMRVVVTILDEIQNSSEKLLYIDEFFKLVEDIDGRLHKLSSTRQKPIAARVPSDRWKKEN